MLLPALGLSVLLSAVPVEVQTLDGTIHAGTLESLQDGRLELNGDGVPAELNSADLLQVQPVEATAPDEFAVDRASAVRLVDGSLLSVKSFSLKNKQAVVVSELLGEIRVPQAEVHSVRLAGIESAVRDAWDAQLARESKTDRLVIRKNDALDFVPGVISGVDEKGVHLLTNSREATVALTRVFGFVFPGSPPQKREPACELLLSSGDRLVLKSLAIQDDRLTGQLVSGPEIAVPLAQVRNVDFGLGRVRFLADLVETAAYKSVGLITSEDVLQLRKNSNSVGGSFIVGEDTYVRGLWIHSGTTLKYRLNRDYRRLQAIVGVDRSPSACARVNPRIRATISGDGRQLFQAEFGWDVEPQSLDLDVAGIRDLVIQIDPASAETIGACEHLVLAEARVIK